MLCIEAKDFQRGDDSSPMLPNHCKDVSVREVAFDLTKDRIIEQAKGKKAYTRTEYIILRNGKEHAIVQVRKEAGVELFRPILDVDVIALPRDIVFIRDDSLDVLNRSQMANAAKDHPGKFVIIQGLFNHVSFIKAEDGLELAVFEVVPPHPAKLSVLVEKALAAGLVDLPVMPSVETVNLNALGVQVTTPGVIFPCRASGMRSKHDIQYLDETPEIKGDVTMVGCDLSKRIFKHIYRKSPRHFINMCPRDLAPRDGRKRIVKCCRVREGFEMDGNMAIVPWGATVQEVAAAINALFR